MKPNGTEREHDLTFVGRLSRKGVMNNVSGPSDLPPCKPHQKAVRLHSILESVAIFMLQFDCDVEVDKNKHIGNREIVTESGGSLIIT